MKEKLKNRQYFIWVIAFFSIYCNAQVTISGTVNDELNEAVSDVEVTLGDKSTYTDEAGNYLFENVLDGDYIITAEDFESSDSQDITVKGQDLSINLVLTQSTEISLNDVIVTGSSKPKRRIESSVAITTLNAEQIEDQAPTSTADLLQVVPGFVVETSGGEVGNNLFSRGIPSAGAYEYVKIQEDGLPVFEDGALQFANADNWFRVDETVATLEAVKGGSSAIFANNSPGGIINFISKEGKNKFKGRAKLSVGDYGLFRTDLNVGGAVIKDKLFYNIGGFYRVDQGVRDPGFDANKGGQIKANFKFVFDKGYVKINYKHLNDRNLFLLPIPLQNATDPEGIAGFDPNYGTLTSRNFSRLRVPQFGGGTFDANLEDGVHPIVNAIGGELKYELADNITLKNTFRQTTIDLNYNAIFSTGGPDTQDGFATDVAQFPISDPANAQYTYVDTGEALAANTLVMRADHWFINKDMQNFANNLVFQFDWGDFDLSLGYYYSNWRSDQYWNWSNYIVDVSDNPRLVNLVDSSTGISRTWNGIERITWLERDAQTAGRLNDFYVDMEYELENWTFNLGARYNSDKYTGYRDQARFFAEDLGILDNNTADDAVTTVLGDPYIYWDYDVNELDWTAATNYKFNNNMAAYLRYSNSSRSPIEEAYYDNASDLSVLEVVDVNQLELGYNLKGKQFFLSASLLFLTLDNVPFTDILANGTSENAFADTENIALELEVYKKLFKTLTLNFRGTLQDPTYKNYTSSDGSFNFDGNTVRRIPNLYFTFRPEVEIVKDLGFYAEWQFTGKRYQDQANQQELPAFHEFNTGLAYKINNIRFGLDIANIFNSIGLTEGNPRNTTSLNNSDIYLARPILGTNGRLSIAIDF